MNSDNAHNDNQNTKKTEKENKSNQNEETTTTPDVEGTGEYGLEQVLMLDESELLNVQKHSGYHFSQDQLDHKQDVIAPSDEKQETA